MVEAESIMWSQTYGGTSFDEAYFLVETSDGGYAIAGSTYSFGAGGRDFWLVKTDANGVLQWSQTYGGTDSDVGYCVVETSDGGYALAGHTYSFGGGIDVWLVKTDASGVVEWNQTYGGADFEFGYCVVETSDGGYAIAGMTESFGAGDFDFWVVKTDEYGVVPETTWIILPLLMIATLLILVSRKRLLHKQ